MPLYGDLDDDRDLDASDISAFVEALAAKNDEALFLLRVPGGNLNAGDFDQNQVVDNLDVSGLITRMRDFDIAPEVLAAETSPALPPSTVPEPTSLLLLGAAALKCLKQRGTSLSSAG